MSSAFFSEIGSPADRGLALPCGKKSFANALGSRDCHAYFGVGGRTACEGCFVGLHLCCGRTDRPVFRWRGAGAPQRRDCPAHGDAANAYRPDRSGGRDFDPIATCLGSGRVARCARHRGWQYCRIEYCQHSVDRRSNESGLADPSLWRDAPARYGCHGRCGDRLGADICNGRDRSTAGRLAGPRPGLLPTCNPARPVMTTLTRLFRPPYSS